MRKRTSVTCQLREATPPGLDAAAERDVAHVVARPIPRCCDEMSD